MPSVKYDQHKALIDLSAFDARQVNASVKDQILDYGAQSFDDKGFVWIRDPQMTVPTAFGSITAAAEQMRRRLVGWMQDELDELEKHLKYLDRLDEPVDEEFKEAESEAIELDRHLSSAKKSRAVVKMVKGRQGEYGMRFHLTGGPPSKAARRLAHAWMRRQADMNRDYDPNVQRPPGWDKGSAKLDQGIDKVLDGFDLLERGWADLLRVAPTREVRNQVGKYLKATVSFSQTMAQWKDDLMLVEAKLPRVEN